MRLDHIVSSVYIIFVWRAPFIRFYAFRLYFVFLPGGHSGEVIPVPIPNTEVKLSYADDTALRGKVGCCQAFLFNCPYLIYSKILLYYLIWVFEF